MKDLQNKLDIQKWIDSQKANKDFCGEYDYCSKCDKTKEYPCALAYTLFHAAPVVEEIEEIVEEEIEETVNEPQKEKYVQLTFLEKLALATDKTRTRYLLLITSLTEAGTTLKISKKHVLVKKNKKSIGKITLTKNAIKLHLACDPKAHEEIPHLDYSNKKAYENMPFTIKITTKKSIKNAISLIK